ncbi:MAG: EamA family transporter [Chroococcales cyanobacterium]
MKYFAIGITLAILGTVTGDFFVKKGSAKIQGATINDYGGVIGILNPINLFKFLQELGIFRNCTLFLGVALLTFHFGGYILAMRNAPVTLVQPMMAATYILDTIIGRLILKERVPLLRWVGVSVIVAGIILLVGFSK